MRIYWHRMRVPVTFHLAQDWRFTWRRMYGVSIGRWFVGAFQAEHDFNVDRSAGEGR